MLKKIFISALTAVITSACQPSSVHASAKLVPTSVDGTITQDTIWTSNQSPYIVTGDMTVNPFVTLTIQPGVEVRFAGNNSLLI